MTPVLIFTDTTRIENEETTLNNVVDIFQAVYNELKATGVNNITLVEIDSLVKSARRQADKSFVDDYVINKITDDHMPHIVNGIEYPRSEVMRLIPRVNTAGIIAALQPVWGNNSQSVFIRSAKDARLNLLTLKNDVIEKVADADQQLATLFTYYTTTDESTKLASDLQNVCDALNAVDQNYNGIYSKKIENAGSTDEYLMKESSIPGLAQDQNKQFVLSLNYIRHYERTGFLLHS